MKFIRSALLVLPALLYGLAVRFRNVLFDLNILRSTQFEVPIICVGNLSAGGNGKTPMVEYLIRLLNSKYTIGVLSRGYGRETKGYVQVKLNALPNLVGDESVQIKNKFPNIEVAVCENRVAGARQMLEDNTNLSLILLDDGFQHRRIKAHIYLLLSDYSNPFFKDHLLPLGRLREPRSGQKRADAIIFTKCPYNVSPYSTSDESIPVFYSQVDYDEPELKGKVFGFSGLANNTYFENYLRSNYDVSGFKSYDDHHTYTERDIQFLEKKAAEGTLVCTEKDMVKIANTKLADKVNVVQIRVHFTDEKFNQWLITQLSNES